MMAMTWCAWLYAMWMLAVLGLGRESELKDDHSNSVIALAHTNATVNCSVQLPAGSAFNGMMWYQDGLWKIAKENANKIKYQDDKLQPKYTINDDNSLVIFDVVVTDTANYTCKIYTTKQTVSDGVVFSEKNATVELLVQDVPRPPNMLTVYDFDSRQVKVSWAPSHLDNNSPITLYIVQIRSDSQKWTEGREIVVGADSATVSIQDLQPYTKYHVRIFSRNSVGKSEPSSENIAFVTSSESPSSRPLDVKAVSTNSTVIKFSWEPPPLMTHHGDLRGYEVVYKEMVGNMNHVMSVEDPEKRSILIEGLKPYTDYIVGIAAFNDAGKGPLAQTTICTLEGIPSKPRITHVSSRMSTSFYVNWEAPKQPNGEIISYELQWVYHKMNKTRIIHGHLTNPMSAFLSGLEPYTQYMIRVAASTGGGKGEFSEIFPALTDVTGPSTPIIENVTELGPTSVFVAWSPPEIIHRKVDSYFLQFWDVNQQAYHKEQVVTGYNTQKLIENLPSNAKYSLRIAGVTQSIFTKTFYVGDFSESIIFELSSNDTTDTDVTTQSVLTGMTGTERHDVQCMHDRMDVFIPVSLLPGTTSMTWSDSSCPLHNNGTHYVGSVKFGDCHTTVQFTGNSVILENVVRANADSSTNVSVVNWGLSQTVTNVPVRCEYHRESTLEFSYIPIQPHVVLYESDYGQFDLKMTQFQSSQFRSPVSNHNYPISIALNNDVYIKLSVGLTNDTDLALTADRCIATPSPSPLDAVSFALVDHGCAQSANVQVYQSTQTEFRFSFRAFQFTNLPGSTVYLHCHVSVCRASDPTCMRTCQQRTKRAVSAEEHPSHLISTGPFVLSAEGSVPMATIVASVCSVVAVVATVLAVVGWKRRRQDRMHTGLVSFDS